MRVYRAELAQRVLVMFPERHQRTPLLLPKRLAAVSGEAHPAHTNLAEPFMQGYALPLRFAYLLLLCDSSFITKSGDLVGLIFVCSCTVLLICNVSLPLHSCAISIKLANIIPVLLALNVLLGS